MDCTLVSNVSDLVTAVVVVLSPHFDDAVLSCWSVLSQEGSAIVANVFARLPRCGSPLAPWERVKRAKDPRERALERAQEDAEALAAVGGERINLDFLDMDYRAGEQDVKPLVEALQERIPAQAHLYAPAGIGGHADHFTVRAAAMALRERGHPVTLYADMPYCMTYGWPDWVTGAEPDPYLDVTVDWATALQRGGVTVRPEDGEVVRLGADERRRKLQALRLYRTQFSVMRKLVTGEGALDYEVFWSLGAASLSRREALRRDLLWHAGIRYGSRSERLLRHRALRGLRPRADSRLGRMLVTRTGPSAHGENTNARSAPERVLVVVPGLAGNGISRHLLDLSSALKPLGVECELFTIEPAELGGVPHADAPPVKVTSGGLPRGRRHRYKLPLVSVRLLRAARRADVVYAGWEVGPALVASYLAARVARRPVFTTIQSLAPVELDHYVKGWAKPATKAVLPRLDAVVCVADGLREIASGMHVEDERMRVIPVGLELERTRSLAARPAPDWLLDEPFVTGVGRLARAKGFDLLLEAHARVLAGGRPHKLVIMGEGEERDALEDMIVKLGVGDSVLLPGFVRNPFPVLARAFLLAAPSRGEGWPMMVGEALALGVPTIASGLPGTRAILGDGRYGELIESESVDALASAMTRHLDDPEPLRAKARSGRNHADTFGIAERARDYARLFAELTVR